MQPLKVKSVVSVDVDNLNRCSIDVDNIEEFDDSYEWLALKLEMHEVSSNESNEEIKVESAR